MSKERATDLARQCNELVRNGRIVVLLVSPSKNNSHRDAHSREKHMGERPWKCYKENLLMTQQGNERRMNSSN